MTEAKKVKRDTSGICPQYDENRHSEPRSGEESRKLTKEL